MLSPSTDVDTAPPPVTQRSCWPIQKWVSDPEIFLGKKVTCSQWGLQPQRAPFLCRDGGGWMGSLPSNHWQPQLPPQLLGGGGLGLTARAQKGALNTHLALLCTL